MSAGSICLGSLVLTVEGYETSCVQRNILIDHRTHTRSELCCLILAKVELPVDDSRVYDRDRSVQVTPDLRSRSFEVKHSIPSFAVDGDLEANWGSIIKIVDCLGSERAS